MTVVPTEVLALLQRQGGYATRADLRAAGLGRRALARAGWRVLRFSWEDVVHHPQDVVAMVRAALLAALA